MILKNPINNNLTSDLVKIEYSETETIWVSNYWDGALSGMLQENNSCKTINWHRRFAIIKLSKEQLEKELQVHEDFQKYVGTHFDGKQLKPPPKFEVGKTKEFYNKHNSYVKSKPFENNKVIGWMEN